ncbi:hypothetical protein MEEL106852_01160 [Megasphaera elsdenii]|uniref:Uncharacterized protein n=1 Tax=Megasphaera elsdenii DSM 20460 TaxID=1064535 RepID=G0VPF8_MEGEL|nr:hypothetical protein [Megasphaera elsdenii]AVO74739.1 hypothetical protein C6362_07245 [Megasphaera elsdenii DSM 20460]CCC73336.1 hypothetical protein MELS_1114 [Megasphaera elsdenii DSM 20460]
MLIKRIPKKWGKAEYVPFKVDGTTLYAGQGENTVHADLQEIQSDMAQTVYIMQDYSGTLSVGFNSYLPYILLMAEIPPYQMQMVDTGEKNKDGDEQYKPERVPIDIDNIQFTLWPMQVAIESESAAANTTTESATTTTAAETTADTKGE